jgi:hypothetical protein
MLMMHFKFGAEVNLSSSHFYPVSPLPHYFVVNSYQIPRAWSREEHLRSYLLAVT